MIITKTPFRISFFGGGTDYPAWYNEHGGMVLASTINKYCYINCRYWPPFFGKKHRIVYSNIELPENTEAIEHPSVRACFQYMEIEQSMEVSHNADLPARSGLGSSSSFTVGLLNALNGLRGRMLGKRQLSLDAIQVEQEVIKENVGSQDQVLAAYGGFNVIEFSEHETFLAKPVIMSVERRRELEDNLMLFYTGISRFASEIAGDQIRNFDNRKSELRTMLELTKEATRILAGNREIRDFGLLLRENWILKKSLSDRVTNSTIDNIYQLGIDAGATAGKILGAGGGGFLLFFAEPECHSAIRQALKDFLHVPFQFESSGSQVIFYEPSQCVS